MVITIKARWLASPHNKNKTNIGRTSSLPQFDPEKQRNGPFSVNSCLDELCLESFGRGTAFGQIEFLFKRFGQLGAYEDRFVCHLGPH